MGIIPRAIMTHREPADLAVSEWGTKCYWALTAIFGLAGLCFLVWSFTLRKPNLVKYYYLSAFACYVLSTGYFAMAAGIGCVAVEVEFSRGRPSTLQGTNPTRQVFWVRYLTWLITTPLVNSELLLLVSASASVLLCDIFLVFMVMATGWGGAVVPSSYKWGFFFYGAIACAGLAFMIAHTGYRLAAAKGRDLKNRYTLCGVVVAVLWTGYGIAWGLSEGGNVISPDGEALLYGMLDLLGGPVFAVLVIWAAGRCQTES